ncbi:MAG: 2OG-Fe(II) oxygenase [Oligoflexia bacterium]|nr:2OG-Fe(II) oxygenase [Oligoflexia bacterium]
MNLSNQSLEKYKTKYERAIPYPHIILDTWFDANFFQKANIEFDTLIEKSNQWMCYSHFNEDKKTHINIIEYPRNLKMLVSYFHSEKFVDQLQELTGHKKLLPDPLMAGGGLSIIPDKGFLNLHTDFGVHPYKKNWIRSVNIILFFNEYWSKKFGGILELWQPGSKTPSAKVIPKCNRMLIFNTNDKTIHGYPEKLNLPPDTYRKTLNLYYYTLTKKDPKRRYTIYYPHPRDNVTRSTLIKLETKLIFVYCTFKFWFKINDRLITWPMKKLKNWHLMYDKFKV